jgi:hypothetical protein
MLAFAAPNFVLLQGVIIGLGYGLLAVGLVLIYRTNRVLNFAQGQVGVIAAVFLVKLTADFKFEYWFALVLSIALAAAVGALSELVLRRLFSRPRVLVMVATIGLSQVLLALTALPFIRPHNLYKPVPVPFDLSFSLGTTIFTPAEVLTLIVAPIVALDTGRRRALHQLGPHHAGHVGERRLGPALRGVDPPNLHADLDGGRCALRLHRHPQRARPDERAHRGPQPRPAALRPHRRAGRRHGQPDRGLRGRYRGGRALRAVAVEHLLHGQPGTGAVHRGARRPAGPGARPAQGQPCGRALHVAARRHHGPGDRRRAAPAGLRVGNVAGRRLAAVVLPLVLNVGNNYLFSPRSASMP